MQIWVIEEIHLCNNLYKIKISLIQILKILFLKINMHLLKRKPMNMDFGLKIIQVYIGIYKVLKIKKLKIKLQFR